MNATNDDNDTDGRGSANSEPRRRFRRAWANLAWVGTGVILATVMLADPLDIHPVDTWMHGVLKHPWRIGGAPKAEPARPQQLYTCSMHPEVIQDKPGPCPICGMPLVPMRMGDDAAGSTTGAAPPSGGREVLFYRNPMDPSITSPVPRKDEMGMDYVPVHADEVEAASKGGATVSIDATTVQNMNVRWAAAKRGDLRRAVRTVGYLDYDQQKMVTVTTKYAGWVERVLVNYVGEPVRKGQPLFHVYSPELVQTQQELLSARAFARRMEGAPEDARRRAQSLVESARERLGYWDITTAQIDRLEKTGELLRTLTVTSPARGLVMMRMPGLEGMAVRPGMELFHIADLSSLWLSVEAFEDQIGWLRVGSVAEVTLSYFPGETFEGRVRYIEPQVNEKTRTVSLKLEVPNPGGQLRAGMYATVRFRPVVAKGAILVPTLALLRTGERNLVIVRESEGRFVPREVTLAGEGDGEVALSSGLGEGEEVVTSGQFLIDSESNLREAIQKLIASRKSE